MVKPVFSNFDVFAITRELDLILSGGTILNVYQIEDILLLKINTHQGKKNLIIKKDTRINLTNYDYPIPKYPSQYILSLRKFLKNRKILSVSQYNFDRIIIFKLSNIENKDNPWKFIIELFNKGNFILIDNNNIVKIAKKYQKYRDRNILANREYSFPLSRGENFLTIDEGDFKELFLNSDTEIVRILARNISISGLNSEEICYRAGIDKKLIGKELNESNIMNLLKSFKSMRNNLLFGNIVAHIVFNQNGEEVSAFAFEMETFKDYNKKSYITFNEAVDDFFSKIDAKIIKKPHDQEIINRIKAQEKILRNQLEYMEALEEKKENYYKIGDFIYSNFKSLENLLTVILNAKAKGYSWENINIKLLSAKKTNMAGAEFFEKVIPSKKELIIKLNDDEVYLDLKKSIGENANVIYSRGKKADKKIKGTTSAIEKTKKNIEKLNHEKESLEEETDILIKKPKKKWYEKFRWFKSSDGFLIIGGRDASSNDLVFKKYIDPNDLVLHTNFPGSPLTIIKNSDNKTIPEPTIKEAADFVASFSRAWKETWGVADVFYVNPDQVSKSPPSGEYLPRGSFMISGKKNVIKNAKIELAIGLELIETGQDSDELSKILYPKIIYGPKTAIQKQFNNIILIVPSKSGVTKGKIAKQIKSILIKNSNKELVKWIKLLSFDDIILCLPTGTSLIKSSN